MLAEIINFLSIGCDGKKKSLLTFLRFLIFLKIENGNCTVCLVIIFEIDF